MVEIIFLMLVLKLPIVYLVAVCWWAVRAEPEPRPPEPALLPVGPDADPAGGHHLQRARRPRRGGPHGRGGPTRRPDRVAVR
ncbi:MAG TPA: hypothetical protein VFB87_10775 [Gaiellaceae bacterium]|nr:hypothetical protein [Gaiellaceae bacterium]